VKVSPSIAWSLLMQGRYQQLLDEIKLDRNSAAIFTMRGYAELALGRLPDAASSQKSSPISFSPQPLPPFGHTIHHRLCSTGAGARIGGKSSVRSP
jgi:hypothetical protein